LLRFAQMHVPPVAAMVRCSRTAALHRLLPALAANFALMCGTAAAGQPAEPRPLALSSKRLPINFNVQAQSSGHATAPFSLTWLGCLDLAATSRQDSLVFGGVSGAFVHKSRLLMVSDTAKLAQPPWWGSGRFFVADLRLDSAKSVPGWPVVVPVGLENVTEQPLRDGRGKLQADQVGIDLEALDVEWPKEAVVGLEFKHGVRRYHFLTPPDSPSGKVILSAPVVIGRRGDGGLNGGRHRLTGIDAELAQCKSSGDNLGGETVMLAPGGRLAVFCEQNRPEGLEGETVGWLADRRMGTVLASYNLVLPQVEGIAGVFYRIAGAVMLPLGNGASPEEPRVLMLFHYWSKRTDHLTKLAVCTLTVGAKGHAVKLQPTEVLDLRKGHGIPVANFEALTVEPVGQNDYVVHMLSNNNFHPSVQRTLLLSLYMKGNSSSAVEAAAQPAEPAVAATTTTQVVVALPAASTASTPAAPSSSGGSSSSINAAFSANAVDAAAATQNVVKEKESAQPQVDSGGGAVGAYHRNPYLACGDCSGNDVFIGHGYERFDLSMRTSAAKDCGAVCDLSPECGGFTYVASQGKCYYRRITACNVFASMQFDCYTKFTSQQPLSVVSTTVPSMQRPPMSRYRKAAGVGCGDCSNNDVRIGAGGERFDTALRWTALRVCGRVCDASQDCHGFNFVDSQSRCYYRKNTDCGPFSNSGFDCYTKIPVGQVQVEAKFGLRRPSVAASSIARPTVMIASLALLSGLVVGIGALRLRRQRHLCEERMLPEPPFPLE